MLQVAFLHGTENPLVNAIEIIGGDTNLVQLTSRLLKDTFLDSEIVVYPNPIRQGETLFVNLPKSPNGDIIRLEMFNPLGAKVLEKEYSGNYSGTRELPMDYNMSTGLYFIQIQIGGKIVKTQKIMVR
jgi:hypothetical protein